MQRSIIALAAVGGGMLLWNALSSPSFAVRDVAAAPPLYRSSVVGTDFDFITADDPSTFQRLDYKGLTQFEMPDKRDLGHPLLQNAHIFDAHFTDGTIIRIAMSDKFGSRGSAEQDAMRYAPRLGKLPLLYRRSLKHLVVHKGGADTTAFAEDKGHFFVIYSDNATKRIATHDLEETIFHEATHASIQSSHIDTAEWRNAKTLDRNFITDYAQTEDQEDFAESALFAYTLIHHPSRIPADEGARIERHIPHRIDFFKRIYSKDR